MKSHFYVFPRKYGLQQGCPTQISWRSLNFFLLYSRAQTGVFLIIQMVFLSSKARWMNRTLGFTGQNKSFSGPHLAREPYVVQAWFTVSSSESFLPLPISCSNGFNFFQPFFGSGPNLTKLSGTLGPKLYEVIEVRRLNQFYKIGPW